MKQYRFLVIQLRYIEYMNTQNFGFVGQYLVTIEGCSYWEWASEVQETFEQAAHNLYWRTYLSDEEKEILQNMYEEDFSNRFPTIRIIQLFDIDGIWTEM